MDSLDLKTRLPPRKRLLAGLKKDSSDCNFLLPIPSISSEFYSRLHKIINSTTLSPEKVIEEVNLVASDAAAVAAAARVNALEKAAAAAKAKAAAKSALELVDMLMRNEAQKDKNKLRKKHVEINRLYESKRPVETDEELARRLHRAMNSSPRITKNSGKNNGGFRKLGKGDLQGVSDSVDKLEDKVVVCSKADFSGRKRKFDHAVEVRRQGSEIVVGKKPKVKRKKLLLSQFNVRDQGKPEEPLASVGNGQTGELELDCAERNAPLSNVKPSIESEGSMKITSMWKCKKFKVSQCYSDSKMLYGLCSNPSSAETSAMV